MNNNATMAPSHSSGSSLEEGTPPGQGVTQKLRTFVDLLKGIKTIGCWVTSNGTVLRVTAEILEEGVEKHFKSLGVEISGQRIVFLSENPDAETDSLRTPAQECAIHIPFEVGMETTDFAEVQANPGSWLDMERGEIIRVFEATRHYSSAIRIETLRKTRYIFLSPNPDVKRDDLRRIAVHTYGAMMNC